MAKLKKSDINPALLASDGVQILVNAVGQVHKHDIVVVCGVHGGRVQVKRLADDDVGPCFVALHGTDVDGGLLEVVDWVAREEPGTPGKLLWGKRVVGWRTETGVFLRPDAAKITVGKPPEGEQLRVDELVEAA